MRGLTVICWSFAAWSLALSARAEEFPYTAYVHADDVYVRSGPGRSYYPTDKLNRRDAVEVYRHDPGGWYAIRPPQGSFSWVSARYLRPTEPGLGVVQGEKVVARVGSQFSAVRDVIQVRLEEGEVVEILGEHAAGGQTWYKISPPAGEFRWVSSTYLSREAPHNGVSQPHRPGRAPLAQSDEQNRAEDGEPLELSDEVDRARPIGAATLASAESDWDAEAADAEDADFHAPRPSANVLIRELEERRITEDRADTVQQASYDESGETIRIADERGASWRNERTASPAAASTARAAAPRGGAYFSQELNAVDLELSQMLAEEPTVWTFRELKRRLVELLDEAGTAVERGQVRKIQHQIARLEDIQQRYRTIGAVMDETDRRNSAIASPPASSGVPGATIAATFNGASPDEYDGQGVLRPVVSRRQDAPRYALVDASGEVMSFISPAPGVNLQPHLGASIGVIGTRGFMPELNKPHVMVRRVEPLQ